MLDEMRPLTSTPTPNPSPTQVGPARLAQHKCGTRASPGSVGRGGASVAAAAVFALLSLLLILPALALLGMDAKAAQPALLDALKGDKLVRRGAAEALGHSLDLIIPVSLRARHWEGYQRVMATGDTPYARQLLAVPGIRKVPVGGSAGADLVIDL